VVRIIAALVAALLFPQAAIGQEPRVSVGGSVTLVTQTHSDDQQVGGTTLGGSALLGVRVSPRVAIEVEPSFGGSYSREYTYRPSRSSMATVIVSRREMAFPVQARFVVGVLEPVLGVGVVRSRIARDATFSSGTPYFNDSRTDCDLALVAGLDAAFKLASRVYLVPAFRMLMVQRGSSDPFEDPLGQDASTGSFTFRYGVGIRAAF
jgi:hypothetical protein